MIDQIEYNSGHIFFFCSLDRLCFFIVFWILIELCISCSLGQINLKISKNRSFSKGFKNLNQKIFVSF